MGRSTTWLLLSICACSTGGGTLIDTFSEPAGENCQNGGVRINSGIDRNGDGELVGAEINATDFICNGQQGAGGSSGGPGNPGTPSECGEREPLRIEGVSGLPSSLLINEVVDLVVETNTANPSWLALETTQALPGVQITDLGHGVAEVVGDLRTPAAQRTSLILSDGCTQAFASLSVPEITTPPAWVRTVALDLGVDSLFLHLQEDAGPIHRMPGAVDMLPQDAALERELPSGRYTATMYAGNGEQALGAVQIEPSDQLVALLWQDQYTTTLSWIDQLTDPVPAGESLVRLWNVDEYSFLIDAYQQGMLVQPVWAAGSRFSTTSGPDLVIDMPLAGQEPVVGITESIALSGLVPDEAYDVFFSGNASGDTFVLGVPVNDALPLLRGEVVATPMPFQAITVDVTDPTGGTNNEKLPYPIGPSETWVGFEKGDSVSDATSTSYRTVHVPGATRMEVTVSVDILSTDAYLEAVQSIDGVQVLDDADAISGTMEHSFFVNGDTVELAVHETGRASGNGYRVLSVGYEL